MRGAGISAIGRPVELLDLAAPRRLAGDQLLIAVKAAGVGNWDEIVRTGGWDPAAGRRWRSASKPLASSRQSASR